jgi:hypothetical protein
VANDVLRKLRRAVRSGSGPMMVTTVADVGFDRCLQLVGELLIAALDREAEGAAGLAGRCVEALENRGWPGDVPLAATLIQTLQGGSDRTWVEVAADLEQLGDLLDGGPANGPGRLDLVTGESWPEAVFRDVDEMEQANGGQQRWLVVWPTGPRAANEDMAEFAMTRDNDRLAAGLLVALGGRGGLTRFKRVLIDWPEDREKWFAFSDDRRRGRARAWLANAGYRARPSRPAAAAQPRPLP